MSVYVDRPDKKYGRMVMCHMMADTTEELLTMASLIGVQHKWIQKPGTLNEHFDICLSKREIAISYGAVDLSNKDLARWSLKRKGYNI